MTKITLNNEDLDLEIELNVMDNWNEIPLKTYFKMIDIISEQNKMEEIDFTIEMISIISDIDKNKLNEIGLFELNKLEPIIRGLNPNGINKDIPTHIEINGINYVPKKNMINITNSEMMCMKNLDNNSYSNNVLNYLSVLLRPGYSKTNEIGEIKWIQTPLDVEDIENRKDIFLNYLKTTDAIPLINFFLTGKKG